MAFCPSGAFPLLVQWSRRSILAEMEFGDQPFQKDAYPFAALAPFDRSANLDPKGFDGNCQRRRCSRCRSECRLRILIFRTPRPSLLVESCETTPVQLDTFVPLNKLQNSLARTGRADPACNSFDPAALYAAVACWTMPIMPPSSPGIFLIAIDSRTFHRGLLLHSNSSAAI